MSLKNWSESQTDETNSGAKFEEVKLTKSCGWFEVSLWIFSFLLSSCCTLCVALHRNVEYLYVIRFQRLIKLKLYRRTVSDPPAKEIVSLHVHLQAHHL